MNERITKLIELSNTSINLATITNTIDLNYYAAYVFEIVDKKYNYKGFKIGSTSVDRLMQRKHELETSINSFISYARPLYFPKVLFICKDRDTAYAMESFIRRFYHQDCNYNSNGQDHFIGKDMQLSKLLVDKRINKEIFLNDIQKIVPE